MNINYQKELDRILKKIEAGQTVPSLLLHSCCAPCSSYVLKYLSGYFRITDFYYNPNITDREEYKKRVLEMKRLLREMPLNNPVVFYEGTYEPEKFLEMSKGLENLPEGGERCFRCYEMRLREAAEKARDGGFDYFTTTLSISPLKNAEKLNEIGEDLGKEFGVSWLPSDFKKKDGYLQSIQLSKQYSLYRQNFCGCVFSKRNTCVTIAGK